MPIDININESIHIAGRVNKFKGGSPIMRKLSLIVIAVVVISLLLVTFGCAKPAPAPAPAPAPKPAPPSDLAVGTKFMPSTTYVIGVAVVKIISKHVEGVTAHAASYATDSYFADAFAKGRLHLDIGTTHTTVLQVHGMGKWEGHGSAPMRLIATGPPYFLGVLANPKSGIKTPADLKGKKWMVIRPGSALLRDVADAIMHGYGLTEQDVDVLEHSSSAEFVAAMKEGRVDAMGWPFTDASPWVEDLATTGKVAFVGDTPEALEKITAKYPMFPIITLPAGTYKGQDKDITTFGILQTLDCSVDLPADLVYKVTAALYDNFEEWSGYHKNVKGFALPAAIEPGKIGIPVHEGAIKYYKEKGFWTAEHEARQKELLDIVKALGPYKPLT